MAIQSGIALVPRSIIKYRIFWIISILEKVSGLIWDSSRKHFRLFIGFSASSVSQHNPHYVVLIKQKTPAIFLAEKRKENPNLFFENRQEGFFVIHHSRRSHAFLHFDLDFSGNYANIAAGIQDFMMY